MTTFESEQEPERRRSLLEDVGVPGAAAGLVGGVLMALVAMSLSAIVGEPVWKPALLVSGVVYRDGAPATAPAVLLGMAIHFAVAIGLGTVFSLMLPRRGTQVAAVLLGFGFGLALQAVMPALIVPHLSPPLARAGVGAGFFLLHLVFGSALGLVPSVRRVLRPDGAEPVHS